MIFVSGSPKMWVTRSIKCEYASCRVRKVKFLTDDAASTPWLALPRQSTAGTPADIAVAGSRSAAAADRRQVSGDRLVHTPTAGGGDKINGVIITKNNRAPGSERSRLSGAAAAAAAAAG